MAGGGGGGGMDTILSSVLDQIHLNLQHRTNLLLSATAAIVDLVGKGLHIAANCFCSSDQEGGGGGGGGGR